MRSYVNSSMKELETNNFLYMIWKMIEKIQFYFTHSTCWYDPSTSPYNISKHSDFQFIVYTFSKFSAVADFHNQ